MIKNLIRWAVYNRLIVLLLATALLTFGVYSFQRVNVEAYPDPRRRSSRWWRGSRGTRPRKSSGR